MQLPEEINLDIHERIGRGHPLLNAEKSLLIKNEWFIATKRRAAKKENKKIKGSEKEGKFGSKTQL